MALRVIAVAEMSSTSGAGADNAKAPAVLHGSPRSHTVSNSRGPSRLTPELAPSRKSPAVPGAARAVVGLHPDEQPPRVH